MKQSFSVAVTTDAIINPYWRQEKYQRQYQYLS